MANAKPYVFKQDPIQPKSLRQKLSRFDDLKRLLIDPIFFGKCSRPFGWSDFAGFVPVRFLTPVQEFAHGRANVRGGALGQECLRKADRVGLDASAVHDRVK